jgi:hypothetical protein
MTTEILADERGIQPAGAQGQPDNKRVGFNRRRHYGGRDLIDVGKLRMTAAVLQARGVARALAEPPSFGFEPIIIFC